MFKRTIVRCKGQAKGYCLCGYQTKRGSVEYVNKRLDQHQQRIHKEG